VAGLLPATDFRVAFYDPAKDEASFPYCAGDCNAPYTGPSVAEIVRTRRPTLMMDGGDATSWLGAPMPGQGGTIGALILRSFPGSSCYGERDMEQLQALALQAAAAIERRQMLAQLEHSAFYDPLTDLPNRRLFLDRLQTALALARRDEGHVSLLCLDLDLFKEVNDTFGHAVGDLLLQEVAMRLRQCVRESDTVGRLGGDEFLVLLNGTGEPNDGLQVAELVRAALCLPFNLAGRQFSISPSIGVALYPDHGEDSRQLIRCADEAMYRAKQAGGNRAQLWTVA
jgi:diguanylate cyclase (GGDEF)-like protein